MSFIKSLLNEDCTSLSVKCDSGSECHNCNYCNGALIVNGDSHCVSGVTCDSQTHFSTTTAEGKPAYIATRFVLNAKLSHLLILNYNHCSWQSGVQFNSLAIVNLSASILNYDNLVMNNKIIRLLRFL